MTVKLKLKNGDVVVLSGQKDMLCVTWPDGRCEHFKESLYHTGIHRFIIHHCDAMYLEIYRMADIFDGNMTRNIPQSIEQFLLWVKMFHDMQAYDVTCELLLTHKKGFYNQEELMLETRYGRVLFTSGKGSFGAKMVDDSIPPNKAVEDFVQLLSRIMYHCLLKDPQLIDMIIMHGALQCTMTDRDLLTWIKLIEYEPQKFNVNDFFGCYQASELTLL